MAELRGFRAVLNPYLECFNPFLESFNPFLESFNPYLERFRPFSECFDPFLEFERMIFNPFLELFSPYLECFNPFPEFFNPFSEFFNPYLESSTLFWSAMWGGHFGVLGCLAYKIIWHLCRELYNEITKLQEVWSFRMVSFQRFEQSGLPLILLLWTTRIQVTELLVSTTTAHVTKRNDVSYTVSASVRFGPSRPYRIWCLRY